MKYFTIIRYLVICTILQGPLCESVEAQKGPDFLSGDLKPGNHFFQMDVLPQDIILGEAGEDNIWNFVNLKSPRLYVFEVGGVGALISNRPLPELKACITDPWGSVRCLNFNSKGDILLSLERDGNQSDLIKHYNRPLLIHRTGTHMGDTYLSGGSWSLHLSASRLKKMGIYYKGDITVAGEVTVREIRDAEGLLYLPGGYFQAYRKFRQMNTAINIIDTESGISLAPDHSISKVLLPIFEENQSTYSFINTVNDALLAEVVLGRESRIDKIWYRSMDHQRLTRFNPKAQSDFALYPATSDGNLRLNFQNFSKGTYELVIYNIVGRPIWRKQYPVDGDIAMNEDLSILAKGTYIYSLLDARQTKLFTRRFVIINP